MTQNLANQGFIDLNSQTKAVFNLKPGDTFQITLQNTSDYLNSVAILYIGDTQQRLGVFTSGFYLVKLPNIGTTHKVTLNAGQILPMAGETENRYSGELQLIKPSGDLKSVAFDVTVAPLDKIQLVQAIAPEQHPYQYLGALATAPITNLGQYQIYYDTVELKFFVYDGTVWVEVV